MNYERESEEDERLFDLHRMQVNPGVRQYRQGRRPEQRGVDWLRGIRVRLVHLSVLGQMENTGRMLANQQPIIAVQQTGDILTGIRRRADVSRPESIECRRRSQF